MFADAKSVSEPEGERLFLSREFVLMTGVKPIATLRRQIVYTVARCRYFEQTEIDLRIAKHAAPRSAIGVNTPTRVLRMLELHGVLKLLMSICANSHATSAWRRLA